MGKINFFIFYLLSFLSVSQSFGLEIKSHQLKVELSPEKRWIKTSDKIILSKGNNSENSFDFFLNSKLVVSAILYKEKNIIRNLKTVTLDNHYYSHYLLRLPDMPEEVILEFIYEGEIYDSVEKSKAPGFVVGDRTKGIIGKEGIFLSEETAWYPDQKDSLALFENIEVIIKQPYEIITQGELIRKKIIKKMVTTSWKNEIPSPGLNLIGGIYIVETREVEGIKLSTYFFPSEKNFSKIFLDAAAGYIKNYSQLIGKYPYKKYDIIENFFTSGYGMPTFTLLGQEVIKRGKESLKPGYLDHEMVHSWWGNFVYYYPEKGNWCEALTTFFANYYPLETQDAPGALRYRRLIAQKYSTRVDETNDYPLRDFKGKEKEIDDDIGYGKGMMVFYMLRKNIGDQPFFSALKNILKTYGGKRVTWEDFQHEFEKEAKIDLTIFFNQWVNKKGAPILEMKEVEISSKENKYDPRGNIYQLQDNGFYEINLPLKIFFPGKTLIQEVPVKEGKTSFEFIFDEPPSQVLIDPDFHIFRKIPLKSLPTNLNILLEELTKVFILPVNEQVVPAYNQIIEQLKNEADLIVSADKFIPEDLGKNSLFIFGTASENLILNKILKDKPGIISFEPNAIIFQGERYEGNEYSFLISFKNPYNEEKFITVYGGLSPAALRKAHYIYYYGWDSFVIFKEGKMIKRGYLESDASFTSGYLLENPK